MKWRRNPDPFGGLPPAMFVAPRPKPDPRKSTELAGSISVMAVRSVVIAGSIIACVSHDQPKAGEGNRRQA
jgi:hypothetical protein